MNHLIFFTLVIAIYFGINEACKINQIIFKNDLGVGKRFQFQCKSSNADSGVRYLNHKATGGVKFKDTGTNTSLWKCVVRQGVNMKYYINLDAYTPVLKAPKCDQLREYTARLDYIYFRMDSYPPVKLYQWKT
ncbi:hypothetical protein CARUB_v10006872mg [Capsella rubella]|uniref:Uncharacterized protein n=1 Tax=Capsella rubella TaxID=81985 RepID=R0F8S2_9BRAS|nr:hypothetical protein CARUB_v10006872mg [Capsella rubella]